MYVLLVIRVYLQAYTIPKQTRNQETVCDCNWSQHRLRMCSIVLANVKHVQFQLSCFVYLTLK